MDFGICVASHVNDIDYVVRAEQLGYDPVQNKYFDDYSKSRRGIKHPKDTRGNDSKDYSVDF